MKREPTDAETDAMIAQPEDPNVLLFERRCMLSLALADWMDDQHQDVHEEIYQVATRHGFDRAGFERAIQKQQDQEQG